MKNKMVTKLLVPVAIVVVVAAGIVGVLLSDMMASRFEQQATEQIASKIQSIRDNLSSVNELSLDKVHATMSLLAEQSSKIGAPSLGRQVQVGAEVVPGLMLGGQLQANNFLVVDHVAALTKGTATLFVKRGEDFIRVSTNVKKTDGSRAIGTLLDGKGKAAAALRQGQAFYGVVEILGNPYMTGYEPLKNSRNDVVGALYVGYPLSTLTQLGEAIAKSKILENGFILLANGTGKIVFQSSHVTADELTRLLKVNDKDASGNWKMTKETYPAWGYSIIAGYPESDLKQGIIKMEIGIVVVSIIVALLLIILLYTLATKMIVKPITQVIANMDNAELNTRLDSNRTDEIGLLTNSFNKFVTQIRQTLIEISESISVIASASAEISSSTEQMAAGAKGQTSHAGEVTNAVEEMTKSIVENSKNAGETSSTAKQAKLAAEQGGAVVRETVQEMKKIATIVKASAGTVQELGRSSDQIGAIISVIDDIADQTNLLALNAAIEAARAGEQGRGFAVVADEVRKLAERTTAATQEIATMIKKIQLDTQGAVISMEAGTKQVDEGIKLADKAGESLREIVEVSQTVTNMVNKIAASSEQQSNASEQILHNVESISAVTGETAQGVEQIARASEDLNRLTENLQALVGKFKLDINREKKKATGKEKTTSAGILELSNA
jgi:methyl-accepting chemotaxis protein